MRKKLPDIVCDLSAIAKGYAVDRVAAALDRQGAENYMVELWGEILTRGRNAKGRAWRIGIERPDPSRRSLHRMVALSGAGIATSGDYRNYREKNGSRLSHLIDPRTGRPIDHRLASVTVIHPNCALADAYAVARRNKPLV